MYIYSFGVVLLEIITGKPVIVANHHKVHISQRVSFKLATGNIKAIVDPRLEAEFDSNSAWKALEIALAFPLKLQPKGQP